jgi:hypothetical protein
MATITPVSINAGGTAGAQLTFAAASVGGDTIAAAAGAKLLVNNASGSSITVTFTGTLVCPWTNGTVHNVPVTVAAGKVETIPVPGQCVDATLLSCGVTYSAVTSVTVAAITN